MGEQKKKKNTDTRLKLFGKKLIRTLHQYFYRIRESRKNLIQQTDSEILSCRGNDYQFYFRYDLHDLVFNDFPKH